MSSSELRAATRDTSDEGRPRVSGPPEAPGSNALSDSGSSAAARLALEGASDAAVLAQVMGDIDLPRETWEDYQRRVYRAMGLLQSRGVPMATEDIEGVLMRNRYMADAPPVGPGSAVRRLTYFRARLREVLNEQERPGGDTSEIRSRVDVLLRLGKVGTGALEVPSTARAPQGVSRPPGLPLPCEGVRAPMPQPGLVDHESTRHRPLLEFGEARKPFQRLAEPAYGLRPRPRDSGGGVGLDDDSVSDPGSRTSQAPERDVTMDRLADALTRLADGQHPRPDRVDKDEESRKGVIRINPNVRWPKLADNPEGRPD